MAASRRPTGAGRPPLTTIVRDGDPRDAVAIAAMTSGIAPERGALVAVALGALVEARLAERGFMEIEAAGGWDGWRLRSLVGSAADAARFVNAVRDAMFAPVGVDEPALLAVASRARALVRRPLADPALAPAAECAGDPRSLGSDALPTVAEIEAWRRAAHGLGRVAVATSGSDSTANAAATALIDGPIWPVAAAPVEEPWPQDEPDTVVYDASGDIAPGNARIVVTAWTAVPERAVAAAPTLGDVRGPLALRLAALDAPARIRSVQATAHADGGCLAIAIDVTAGDLSPEWTARVATAAALARQELAVQIGDTVAPTDFAQALAMGASDPREAAERAAWWSLAGTHAGVAADAARIGLVVGTTEARDPSSPAPGAMSRELRREIDRATLVLHAPVVEARVRVERGQGEVWILVGTACGTAPEANDDAGASAAVAAAAADRAVRDGAGDAFVETFVAPDGVGILAHGPAHEGESPRAHARRIADLAARAFAAGPLDPKQIAQGRMSLLVHSADLETRVLGALGSALAPGHPSWVEPFGTTFGLASSTDASVALRSSAIRAGPLRVAVLVNADQAQADAAVDAVDRWISRRPDEARACSPTPAIPAPRPGTYAVEIAGGARSEVLLAFPLAAGDGPALRGKWIAAALGGKDGLLARALGAMDGGTPLATEWGAAVVGAPRRPALVVRIVAREGSLDSAVAQARALLERLRTEGLHDADRVRAESTLNHDGLIELLDPRARTINLWRGESPATPPSLDELDAFASLSLRDDSLIVVAARPPRAGPPSLAPVVPRQAGSR